jgi:uncharacterized membrane protein YedE/YeeE
VKSVALAAVWGALFGLGLVISGMVQPGKVLGFLDFTGVWDPSLMFVMVGAFCVFAVLRAKILRRDRSLLGASFPPKAVTVLDARLLGGAAVFGLGWGLAGYCPGPAIVSAGSGSLGAGVVLIGMIAGIRLADVVIAFRTGKSQAVEAREACS